MFFVFVYGLLLSAFNLPPSKTQLSVLHCIWLDFQYHIAQLPLSRGTGIMKI